MNAEADWCIGKARELGTDKADLNGLHDSISVIVRPSSLLCVHARVRACDLKAV
jgi:hypothetical protein